jgi:hypothetical protein
MTSFELNESALTRRWHVIGSSCELRWLRHISRKWYRFFDRKCRRISIVRTVIQGKRWILKNTGRYFNPRRDLFRMVWL